MARGNRGRHRRVWISPRRAREAGHPELAGKRLRLSRSGGTTRYLGRRGELKGHSFSRSLVDKILGLEVSPQEFRAQQVRRLQVEEGLSLNQARQRAAVKARMRFDDDVARLMQEKGVSQAKAERDIMEADRILRQPRSRRDDDDATWAMRVRGLMPDGRRFQDSPEGWNRKLVESGLGAP